MTNRIDTNLERAERNRLFEEFDSEATRVSQECARMPYGDMPGIELDFYAQTLDILRSVKVQKLPRQIAQEVLAGFRSTHILLMVQTAMQLFMSNEKPAPAFITDYVLWRKCLGASSQRSRLVTMR